MTKRQDVLVQMAHTLDVSHTDPVQDLHSIISTSVSIYCIRGSDFAHDSIMSCFKQLGTAIAPPTYPRISTNHPPQLPLP
jgi:hypothetical protein